MRDGNIVRAAICLRNLPGVRRGGIDIVGAIKNLRKEVRGLIVTEEYLSYGLWRGTTAHLARWLVGLSDSSPWWESMSGCDYDTFVSEIPESILDITGEIVGHLWDNAHNDVAVDALKTPPLLVTDPWQRAGWKAAWEELWRLVLGAIPWPNPDPQYLETVGWEQVWMDEQTAHHPRAAVITKWRYRTDAMMLEKGEMLRHLLTHGALVEPIDSYWGTRSCYEAAGRRAAQAAMRGTTNG